MRYRKRLSKVCVEQCLDDAFVYVSDEAHIYLTCSRYSHTFGLSF